MNELKVADSDSLAIYGPDNAAAESYCDSAGITYYCPANTVEIIDDATYSFDVLTGTLTVSGTGSIDGYAEIVDTVEDRITSVVIEEGITAVEMKSGQFYWGTPCFSGFKNLTTVSLPSTLLEIGYGAFCSDTSLTSLTIPVNLTSIDTSNALLGLTGLMEYYVEEGNEYFTAADGVLYNSTMSTIIRFPAGRTGEYEIENSVSVIEDSAFYRSCLTKLILPETLKYIYSYAFGYSSIEYIEFAVCPNYISNSAFNDSSDKKYIIGYHSEQDGWTNMLDKFSELTNILWLDLNSSNFTADFQNSDISISSGEKVNIKLTNDIFLSTYEFYTSDPSVAVVSTDGVILGCNNGSATITGYSEVLNNMITCKVTVTGYNSTSSDYSLIQLEEGEINYTSADTFYLDAIVEDVNGYYYLYGTKLYFHSFYCDKYLEIYDFNSLNGAYIKENVLYVIQPDGNDAIVIKYSLKEQKVIDTLQFENMTPQAIGVDSTGKIYIAYSNNTSAVYKISLYDKDGALLDTANVIREIYRFTDFNALTGEFYYEAFYNYRTWGYDHDAVAEFSGKVKNNKITLASNLISCTVGTSLIDAFNGVGYMAFIVPYVYNHQNSCSLLNDNYLVGSSIIFGTVYIVNMSLDEETYSDNSVQISRTFDYDETSNYSVNAVYNENNKSIIININNTLLEEIDPDTGEVYTTFETSHYVFDC